MEETSKLVKSLLWDTLSKSTVTTSMKHQAYTYAFSQNFKSGCPKCAIGSVENEQFRKQLMKNKTVFFKKWVFTGHPDSPQFDTTLKKIIM